MAASLVVDGRRPGQKYYFDGARAVAPKKHTLAWVVDRIQRQDAVKNALLWLIVKSGGERPTSITEFFAMNVGRFGEEGQKQLQVFGDIVDRKMQNAWASPQVRSMNMLEKFVDLIPPIIRQHYEDIVAGGIGYQGYRRAVYNIASARWDWQVDVPCTTGGNNRGRLPI
jgi:hypothetical protein